MALRNIITEPDAALRRQSREIKQINQRILTLLDDMAETMRAADGVGLAAPQVGVLRRVVVIDIGDGLIELINPVILQKSGSQTGQEACLSCPGRLGIVTRPKKVTVQALNRNGEEMLYEAEDFLARAMCHEIDHLEGQLFLDIMEKEIFEGEEDGEESEK